MEICTTNGITVRVETQFLPGHSNARAEKFLFGYHITIENGSPFTVQLLRRHWNIWDSNGMLREVDGDGIIGQQPILEPGTVHSYSSYCNLITEMGRMSGTYLMMRLDNETEFDVVIPEFKMVVPFKMN
ncbi:MAG: Co2+/Mg2+ efflux protein ApaG [Lewinellaceae bacterium]|nr:Co2+/Mg2+ efflux protein ApaG [Lewinellaceae bacterium]